METLQSALAKANAHIVRLNSVADSVALDLPDQGDEDAEDDDDGEEEADDDGS